MTTSETPNPESFLEESQIARNLSTIAPLPEPIAQNIEAIVELHKNAERAVSRHQRLMETATTFFSRPMFLYVSLLVVTLWMLPYVLPDWGLPQFDPPPFELLQLVLGIIALPIAIAVLIKQERQEKLAEQRMQLSLQLNLLSEQKIAKIIALLEELRCDLPNVNNRYDPEAEMMKQATDPQVVIETLEQKLEEELAELQKQEFNDRSSS